MRNERNTGENDVRIGIVRYGSEPVYDGYHGSLVLWPRWLLYFVYLPTVVTTLFFPKLDGKKVFWDGSLSLT